MPGFPITVHGENLERRVVTKHMLRAATRSVRFLNTLRRINEEKASNGNDDEDNDEDNDDEDNDEDNDDNSVGNMY